MTDVNPSKVRLRALQEYESLRRTVDELDGMAAQLMAAMRSQGRGGLDHTALLQQVDELSGRTRWGAR